MRLGPITLRDFEVASGVSFGGTQAVVKHQLGSGQRVVDVLGPETGNIRFAGVFSGEEALRRAQIVDRIRKTGRPVELSWGTLRYDVIVSRFSASYETRLWIPYETDCIVVQPSGISYGGTPSSTATSILGAMLSAASTLIVSIPSGSLLQPRLGLPDDGLANVTQASFDAAAIARAQLTLEADIADYESRFAEASLLEQQTPPDATESLAELDAACQGMCTLVAARAYLAAAGLTTGVP